MIALLRILRRLDVDLPVEVFHYDDELRDPGQRQEIEELGARLVVVSEESVVMFLGCANQLDWNLRRTDCRKSPAHGRWVLVKIPMTLADETYRRIGRYEWV